MLTEYRYRNEYGTYEYFMSDPQRAIALMEKRIKVEYKKADPFNAHYWQPVDPDIGKSKNYINNAKYDYETVKKLMDLRQQGIFLSKINEITGIDVATISYMTRGFNTAGKFSPTYQGYLERYKREISNDK